MSETKMLELIIEPKPLNMDGGWDAQVNGRADRAEEDRIKKLRWEDQQKAYRRARRRFNVILAGLMVGLALIAAGGVALNYIPAVPTDVAISVAIIGISAFMFTLGVVVGYQIRK